MDITGARWSLKGAEAVLCMSGDFSQYWQFHLQQEHHRNHQALYQTGIPLLNRLTNAHCSTSSPPKLMLA